MTLPRCLARSSRSLGLYLLLGTLFLPSVVLAQNVAADIEKFGLEILGWARTAGTILGGFAILILGIRWATGDQGAGRYAIGVGVGIVLILSSRSIYEALKALI